jgi:hypothetical protein
MLEKEDTMIVLPAIMTTEINLNHAETVTLGDEISLGDITIKAFYMYT